LDFSAFINNILKLEQSYLYHILSSKIIFFLAKLPALDWLMLELED